MTMQISRAVYDALRREAAATPDVEVCGLLFGAGGWIEAYQAAANIAPDPAKHFEIDPEALFAAQKAERSGGPRLIGYYHSHPNGLAQPSEKDRAQAAPDGKIWLIVAAGDVKSWRAGKSGFTSVALEIADVLALGARLRQRIAETPGPHA